MPLSYFLCPLEDFFAMREETLDNETQDVLPTLGACAACAAAFFGPPGAPNLGS